MNGAERLPGGWSTAQVRDLVDLTNGFAFKPSHWTKVGLPIIRIQNLNNPGVPFNYCPDQLPDNFLVHPGNLLFAWSGTPGTSFGAHIWRGGKAWLNQHIFKVQFDERYLNKKFLQLAINRNLDRYVMAAHGGAGLAHITKGTFESSELIIPPLAEQHRIVEEVEKQFTRLDAAVAALKRVRVNLKRYRASVLKAACEGRLVPTEAELARAEGRDYEPADQLLVRILKERRVKWEADQLANVKAAGKVPKDDKRKTKYQEPAAPDTSDLPELPEGWAWVSAEQLSDGNRAITYGVIKLGEPVENGVPTLRSSDVRQLRLDLHAVKRISPAIAGKYKRTFLQGGEALITVRGTLGGVVLAPSTCAGYNISREVAMLALVDRAVGPIATVLMASPPVQNWLLRNTKGIAYTGINIETVKRMPIPLPPHNEHRRIVAEVERRLSVIQELQGSIDANLKRAERLRQTLLKCAFEGKLVAQDPNDEPASALLERIRTERARLNQARVGAKSSPRTRSRRATVANKSP